MSRELNVPKGCFCIIDRFFFKEAAVIVVEKEEIRQRLIKGKSEIESILEEYPEGNVKLVCDVLENCMEGYLPQNIYFLVDNSKDVSNVWGNCVNLLSTNDAYLNAYINIFVNSNICNNFTKSERIFNFCIDRISTILAHEVIHLNQLLREYESGNKNPHGSLSKTHVDYFFNFRELMTYANDAAYELLALFSYQEVIEKLKTLDYDLRKSGVMNQYISLYLATGDKKSFRTFLKYLYNYLEKYSVKAPV